MDIQAVKPVSSVPASPVAAGKHGADVRKPDAQPSEPAKAQPVQPPVRDLQHTLTVVAEQLQEYLRASGRDLEFRVDGDAGATVITVRNASTGEVIRQIPNEEALTIMRRLNAQSGTFVDLTV